MSKIKGKKGRTKKDTAKNSGDPKDPVVAPEVEVLPAEEPSETETAESDEIKPDGIVGFADSANATPIIETQEDEDDDRSSDVVRYDALQAYLTELRQYPPISREEEKELALRYRQHGDIQAAYRLVTSNLRLVVLIAREYERATRNLLDLVQEGNIGLMEAVKNYDPSKDVRLPTYATWWIRAYIIRYLIANWRMVKIGTTQAQRKLFFNLQKEKEKLEREGFYPTAKLLANRLDVKESEVLEMQQRLGSSDLSADAPVNENEGESNLYALLPAEQASAEDLVAKQEIQEIIKRSFDEFTDTLNPRERSIFHERLLGEEKATLEDLALKFNISRERVRQIEARIKERLKVFMTERLDPSLVKGGGGL